MIDAELAGGLRTCRRSQYGGLVRSRRSEPGPNNPYSCDQSSSSAPSTGWPDRFTTRPVRDTRLPEWIVRVTGVRSAGETSKGFSVRASAVLASSFSPVRVGVERLELKHHHPAATSS